MFEEKRLHPTTIFFNFFQFLKEFALPIILGFFTFRGQALFYLLIILVAIFIINLVFSIASWYRFTYRVEDGELRIEHGIFVRKKRYISINRIQSINLTQSVFHRLFKLTKVQIETAGRSEEHTSELQSRGHLVCRLLLDKKNNHKSTAASCAPDCLRSYLTPPYI